MLKNPQNITNNFPYKDNIGTIIFSSCGVLKQIVVMLTVLNRDKSTTLLRTLIPRGTSQARLFYLC